MQRIAKTKVGQIQSPCEFKAEKEKILTYIIFLEYETH